MCGLGSKKKCREKSDDAAALGKVHVISPQLDMGLAKEWVFVDNSQVAGNDALRCNHGLAPCLYVVTLPAAELVVLKHTQNCA
jgi:hypothetical protein